MTSKSRSETEQPGGNYDWQKEAEYMREELRKARTLMDSLEADSDRWHSKYDESQRTIRTRERQLALITDDLKQTYANYLDGLKEIARLKKENEEFKATLDALLKATRAHAESGCIDYETGGNLDLAMAAADEALKAEGKL